MIPDPALWCLHLTETEESEKTQQNTKISRRIFKIICCLLASFKCTYLSILSSFKCSLTYRHWQKDWYWFNGVFKWNMNYESVSSSHHQHCKERQMWAGALYGVVVDFCLTAKRRPIKFSFKEKRANYNYIK